MLRYDYDHLITLDVVFLQCQYFGKYESNGIKGFILVFCDGMDLSQKFELDGRFSEELMKGTMKYVFGSLYQL